MPSASWRNRLKQAWEARVQADPNFAFKSAAEVGLAASTQLAAELAQRGADRLLPEIDFVVGGVLTAVAGKYLAMWKVAPTKRTATTTTTPLIREPRVFNLVVPTNAFQPWMMDGVTRPSMAQRAGSMVAPVVPLFQAGVVASLIGYGLASLFTAVRKFVVPSYVSVTRNMNLVHASMYTGAFLATVSNLRYQILQGLIEPWIVDFCRKTSASSAWRPPRHFPEPWTRNSLIFAARVANGILGSYLAISGMKHLGLQRLKS
jgi:hypothetical protein